MNKNYSGKCERNINDNNWCSGCRHVSRDSDPGHIKRPVYEVSAGERREDGTSSDRKDTGNNEAFKGQPRQ